MTALLDHIWRLMTFRHNLDGLSPQNTSTFVAVLVATWAASCMRFGVEVSFMHAIVVMLLGTTSQRAATAYALLSTGIDCIGIAVPDTESLKTALGLWELAAAVVVLWRDHKFSIA